VAILRNHEMVPSMSRPADPYDNASCESFIKTLKCEEIYANEYQDLDHLRSNIEEFIERYYNRVRLHSVSGLNKRAGRPIRLHALERPGELCSQETTQLGSGLKPRNRV